MRKRATAVFICVALVTSACASAGGPRYARAAPQSTASPTDPALMADYLQRLPAGSKVKVERTDGHVLKGTLMKVEPDAIVVQKHTRVPETPVNVPMREIARVTVDTGSSTGRTVGITVAASVGATFSVLFLLAALLGG